MIWATVSIGLTVLIALWTARPQRSAFGPSLTRHWLVLPDEPLPLPALALPEASPARSVPAVVVTYPAWSASSHSWRAEKPLKPWFRSMAPYAVAAAFGAVSLDLSTLGLGVPEIVADHAPGGQPAAREPFVHDLGLDRLAGIDLSALFETSHDPIFAMESIAWDQPDAIIPAWQLPHQPSHDWWA